MQPTEIRSVEAADIPDVAAIYNHYVREATVTFEEAPVSYEELGSRSEATEQAKLPWLVASMEGTITGYAYAALLKNRFAYRFTAETTVYLRPSRAGEGSVPRSTPPCSNA